MNLAQDITAAANTEDCCLVLQTWFEEKTSSNLGIKEEFSDKHSASQNASITEDKDMDRKATADKIKIPYIDEEVSVTKNSKIKAFEC